MQIFKGGCVMTNVIFFILTVTIAATFIIFTKRLLADLKKLKDE